MAVDPRKRQKQLQRRAAKRKDKHQLVVREKLAGIPERLAAASKYPILDCWITTSLWKQGIGWVCLSRDLPNGFVAYAIFLVDRYCLGVKNVVMNVASRFAYDSKVVRDARSAREAVHPAKARKLLEDAVAYAQSLGLPPHADYARAVRIFGDIDSAECTETFEFGKDGKPFFIAGPNDTPERCHRIMNALQQATGPGGSDFLIPVAGTTDVRMLTADQSHRDEQEPAEDYETGQDCN
jgi:hypothetical protein